MTKAVKFSKSSIDAHIIDAIGGGVCPIHGKYYGLGKHGLRACPFCDITAYYTNKKGVSD